MAIQSKSRSKILVSKVKISNAVVAVTPVVVGAVATASIKNALEVFDETGTSLGFIYIHDIVNPA